MAAPPPPHRSAAFSHHTVRRHVGSDALEALPLRRGLREARERCGWQARGRERTHMAPSGARPLLRRQTEQRQFSRPPAQAGHCQSPRALHASASSPSLLARQERHQWLGQPSAAGEGGQRASGAKGRRSAPAVHCAFSLYVGCRQQWQTLTAARCERAKGRRVRGRAKERRVSPSLGSRGRREKQRLAAAWRRGCGCLRGARARGGVRAIRGPRPR